MKVLHICPTLDSDGIAKVLYSYFSRPMCDVNVDFVVHDYIPKGFLEDDLKSKGCNIFRITAFEKSKVKCLFELNKILATNKYDVIHCHMHYRNVFCVLLAFFHGIKVRITHCHVAFEEENKKQRLKRFLIMPITKMLATDFWACSTEAGYWMYGKRICKKNNFYVMPNAIDIESYKFSSKGRQSVRDQLNVGNSIVVGCIGRFAFQKNYEKTISVFKEIGKKYPDSRLMIIGTRENAKLNQLITSAGVYDRVIQIGITDYVSSYLNAMDIFLLPSRYEGLGIVYIEAQANGLPCVASNRVPMDTNVTDLIRYIPLEADDKQWAEEIIKLFNLKKDTRREDYCENLLNSCFNIDVAVLNVREKYMSTVKGG